MVHVHSSGENKRLIFNVPCFIEKTCFEIAHDDTFRGMIADTNNLASQQKKTTCREHRLYESIQKHYIAIIDGNNKSTHSNVNSSDLEGMSDRENNDYLKLSCKMQKLTESSKKRGPLELHHENANVTPNRQELTDLGDTKHVPCAKYKNNNQKCD